MKVLAFLLVFTACAAAADEAVSVGHRFRRLFKRRATGVSSGYALRAPSWNTLSGKPSLIFGHRGDKPLMPEHTLASWYFAAINNADFLEPDVVLSKDNVPVCLHDLTLTGVTDVDRRKEFAHKKVTKSFLDIDGNFSRVVTQEDYFANDFTVAELKSLKKEQARVGVRPQFFNDMKSPYFQIPTFEEYLDHVERLSTMIGRNFGVIPELKHPEYFRTHTPDLKRHFEDKIISILEKRKLLTEKNLQATRDALNGKTPTHTPVILQNFDFVSLQYMRSQTDAHLCQLIDLDARLLTRDGLDEVLQVADSVGFWKQQLVDGPALWANYTRGVTASDEEIARYGGYLSTQEIISTIHGRGKHVIIYTIYDSREPTHRLDNATKKEELFQLFDMGVDGIFCENVQECVAARNEFDILLRNDRERQEIDVLSL